MIQFLYGEDTFTLALELRKLKASFLQKHKAAAVEEINITDDIADRDLRIKLHEVLEAQGLFAKEKLIIFRDVLDKIGQYSLSQEYLLGPSLTPPHEGGEEGGREVTVVFVQQEKFDKRSKFFKFLQKSAKAKEFALPREDKLKSWIREQLGTKGFEIEPSALAELTGRFGEPYSLWQVTSELEKLMLYSNIEKKIGQNEVKDIIAPNLNYDVFSLTNAIAEGQATEAVKILEELVEEGTTQQKTQIIQIIGALASQIHSLLLVKNVSGSPQEIAKILGWKEGRVFINTRLAKKFTTEKLKKLLSDLKQIDLRAKTSDEPIKLLLTLFIQKARPASSSPGEGRMSVRTGEVELKSA